MEKVLEEFNYVDIFLKIFFIFVRNNKIKFCIVTKTMLRNNFTKDSRSFILASLHNGRY